MVNKSYFKILFILVCLIFMGGALLELEAQCPMCRMAAESNLANGGTEGKGLNKGILYMLAMPYLLVCTGGFIWYKNNKQADDEESDSKDSEE